MTKYIRKLTQRNQMDELPDHIIEYIFEFNDYADYNKLTLTCSLFSNIVLKNVDYVNYVLFIKKIRIDRKIFLFNKNTLFKLACNNAELKIAQYLYRSIHVSKNKLGEIFEYACKCGHLEIVKWLYSLGRIDISKSEYNAFLFSSHNHISIVKWFCSLNKIPNDKIQQAFEVACRFSFEIAKWLHSTYDFINIHADNECSFRMSCCMTGDLECSKWLYSLGGINIHDENIFICCCHNGHFDICKWLYSLGGVNIHARNDEAFFFSCYMNHLDIAQWLYSLGGININVEYQLFKVCCRAGWIEIVQWLYSIGNIRVNKDEINDVNIYGDKLEIIEWLHSLG